MSNSELKQREQFQIANDFRSRVTNFQSILEQHADGENILCGTEQDPIVSDSKVIPIKHYFMDGVYVREMSMQRDSAVVGAIHKHLHMCFLLKGRVTVFNEHETIEHIAPCFIISTPGVKRVLYAHEDSVWFNTHKNPTNTEDLKQLESEVVALSYEEYEEYTKNK